MAPVTAAVRISHSPSRLGFERQRQIELSYHGVSEFARQPIVESDKCPMTAISQRFRETDPVTGKDTHGKWTTSKLSPEDIDKHGPCYR